MNKSILVIDTPEVCNECPCFYDYLRCQANINANVLGDRRPKNCPLRPIPEMKSIDYEIDDIEDEFFTYGYNTCIDELLGEK